MLEKSALGSSLRSYIGRLKDHGVRLQDGMYLAGGALRRAVAGHSLDEGDFDIYVKQALFSDILCSLGAPRISKSPGKSGSIKSNKTYDYIVADMKLQFHITEKPIMEILSGFDYTCCQLATDGQYLYSKPPALEDARNLVLSYTGSAGALSVPRAFRLMAMGFKPSKVTLQQLEKLAIKDKIGVIDW